MKPQPIAEIVIETLHSASVRVLHIYCASDDANEWVRQHAPEFGWLEAMPGRWRLEVSPLYDVEQVAAYIGRQGQELK